MYSNDQEEIKLHIWINGKGKETLVNIYISSAINTLKRLKDEINSHIKNRFNLDKMIIFNSKGLEVDEVDIQYLRNGQVLFVSQDGQPFNPINYLNQYEFVKYVKSGGYGKIYIAKDLITEQLVAIKKIETNLLSNEEIYNISREAVYLESFKHKHIIRIYCTFLYNNNFYTIMQLAKGGELESYIKENKILNETEAKRIFKQLHEAVAYIHGKNVIHRDLNPYNVLFLDVNRENLVVIDFGISGTFSGNVKEKINAGTVRFVPPEVASGINMSSNPKIDIWAMGVILYYMLFGTYPFDGTIEDDILHKITSQPLTFDKKIYISKTCKEIIKNLLDKNPGFRIDLNDNLFQTWYDQGDESLEVIDDEIENTQVPKYSFSIQSSSEVISSKNSLSSKNEKIKNAPLRTSKSTMRNNNIPRKINSSSNVFDRLNSIKLSRLNTNIVPDPGLLKVAGLIETTSISKLDIYKPSKSKPKLNSSQIMNKISGPINLKSITQSAKTKK